MIYDFIVIGGGIVGLATAMELLAARRGSSLLLLEKETAVARHQTGRNSGVIHAGIYYAPGSLKANFCRSGALATKEFCSEHGISYETCGKLLVATNELELQRMEGLEERARLNSIIVKRLDPAQLMEREPNIAGKGALLVNETGIVDYPAVCRAMQGVVERAGGTIRLGHEVTRISETGNHVEVVAGGEAVRGRQLVACAGLQSDRLARLAGLNVEHRIVPFRGEYFRLPASRGNLIKSLIYPIPDPELPFLGIHLTRMMDGSITVGPNAVLGLAREDYSKLAISLRDMADMASFPGFWKVVIEHFRSGLQEWRNSLLPRFYLEACRKYCPDLTLEDLLPHPAGIRAQAVTARGELVHDFLFLASDRMLHICNAPSPAATSAIPIARMIADRCLEAAV